MKAVMYTTKTCVYCPMAKQYLTSRGVEVIEKDASDPAIREEALKVSGYTTVPVTVMNGGVVVGYSIRSFRELLTSVLAP